MSYSRKCPTCYGEGKMFYGRCKTCDGLGQVGVIFTDLVGLMGMCEMECALAILINKASESGKPLSKLVINREDFKEEERDGFDELQWHGWLQKGKDGFSPTSGLVKKAQSYDPAIC